MKIFLIGFMGSGKSTLGKKAASFLTYDFVDLDEEIEKSEGMNISGIFRIKGEGYFREAERRVLREVVGKEGSAIIACGGGTPCFGDNMDYMNRSGKTVYLRMTAKALCSRLEKSKAVRPLLRDKEGVDLLGYVETLLNQREPCYMKSSFIINGLDASPADIAGILK